MTERPATVGTVIGLSISLFVGSVFAQFTKDWAADAFGLLPLVWLILAGTVVSLTMLSIWIVLQRNFGTNR